MRLRPILVLLAAAGLAGADQQFVGAEETPPAPEDLAPLVERLGAPDRAERIAAERELLSTGPAILDRLPVAEDATDPAIRAALVRIRKRLEEDRAAEIVRAAPVTVTLGGRVSLKPVAGATGRLVRVPLDVRVGRNLRPLFLSYAARDFQLTAADGRTLAAFTPEAKYELPFAGEDCGLDVRFDFLSPAEEFSAPLTLTGTFTATIAAGDERFIWPIDAGAEKEQRRGSVRVRLREIERRPEGIEVEIAVVYDRGGPAFESHRTWVYHNDAELVYVVDQDGKAQAKRLDHEPGFSTIAQSDGGVILRYRFPAPPAEANEITFRYTAPTNILNVPVEVTIENLEPPASGGRQPPGPSER